MGVGVFYQKVFWQSGQATGKKSTDIISRYFSCNKGCLPKARQLSSWQCFPIWGNSIEGKKENKKGTFKKKKQLWRIMSLDMGLSTRGPFMCGNYSL